MYHLISETPINISGKQWQLLQMLDYLHQPSLVSICLSEIFIFLENNSWEHTIAIV
jgi:hypothetical protein